MAEAGEGKCEHSGVEPSARDPQEVSSTLNHSEGHRFRQPQGGQGSKDHWAGKGSKERGKAARFMEGKEMGSRGEALSSEDGPNTDQLLEGETSRDSMKEKNTPDHLEEEMAVCSPQKRKPAERTQDNTRELVPRTKQMGAEPIGDFLESNACSLDVGENLELLNRGQVAMNVQGSPFEIFEQGCPSESDFITPTLYKRKSARLGCLNKSVVGEDEIGVIRMCDDQAIVASVAGVDDDKCSISCTGDRELCAPLVSAIGNPPQFEKAEYSEGYQASVVGDIDSGMFSALDRSEPLDENADKDGTGISGITSVNRALQSCASPRAELEERGITAEEEYNHSLNLLKRVDESMESSDDNFTTKRRKHAPECDTEDLQVIKDSGPIGQRKNGWHNDLECREDEELQIKRKMKSAPVKGNLGIFDKANQEFQVEDYTPDLVVLNVEQNITYHGDPPSPTKQISVSKKPASHEYSGVSELEEESTEKSTQCSRSPEIQVLKKLSVTKNSNMLERQPKKNDHLGGSPKLYGTRPVLQLNQFVCCDDSQIDEYSTRLEESSTQLETEHSSPTDSQMEVDKVRKNIQSLMKEFNLNLGTVTQAFLKNNGELEATKYFLKNGARPDGYPIWTQQDDLQLINEDDENKIHLIKKFGTHNVKRRIEFLKS